MLGGGILLFDSLDLNKLSLEVASRISPKRYAHTKSVEECALMLGDALEIDDVSELRAAALLHDVAKEIPIDKQIEMLKSADILLDDDDFNSEGVIHSFTAPIVIKRDFPKFATQNILSATEKHTVGAENMSLFDKIVFISDYAEFTRPYVSCIKVRDFLFTELSQLNYNERIKRLDDACVMAIDFTINALKTKNQNINRRIYLTRNSLLQKKV